MIRLFKNTAMLILILFSTFSSYGQSLSELRVQLPWYHSSQFTGLYVAQIRKHFENEGLSVKLIEGGPTINPMAELQEGRVDIAIGGLKSAWVASEENKQVTNVAQIVSGSSFVLVCRMSAGVFTPKDIKGKTIGIFNDDDKPVLEGMLHELAIPLDSIKLINQQPDGIDLVNHKAACVTAMIFNEYLKIMEQGVPYSDLVVLKPDAYGIAALSDGVYVNTSQLQSPEFRHQLVGFVRALREGWNETRIAPSLSLEAVKAVSAHFDRDHELRTLESMLTIIPSDPSKFGQMDIATYEEESERYIHHSTKGSFIPENIWTHHIWNELEKEDGRSHTLTVATKFYVDHISHLMVFKTLVFFGVFVYALSGVLEAINRNYDLWGRVILAFLSGIGGGTLRDLIIGGERLPFYYVKDYRYPLGILLVVLITSIIVAIYPNAHKSATFKKIKKYSDVFGFSALATAGTMIAISADMPWFWVPALGALTCAGGGMLRDIVINQEPMTFRGVIYEEAAIIGGLFILGGLILANQYEHTALPVYVSIFSGMGLIVSLRLAIYHFGISYPHFLGGGQDHGH